MKEKSKKIKRFIKKYWFGFVGCIFILTILYFLKKIGLPPEGLGIVFGVIIGWLLSEISISLKEKREESRLLKALSNELVFNQRIVIDAINGQYGIHETERSFQSEIYKQVYLRGYLVGKDSGFQSELYEIYRIIFSKSYKADFDFISNEMVKLRDLLSSVIEYLKNIK